MNLRLAGVEPLVGPTGNWHDGRGSEWERNGVYETCDQCGRQILARQTYFDGQSFLCSACVRQASQKQKS